MELRVACASTRDFFIELQSRRAEYEQIAGLALDARRIVAVAVNGKTRR
jgi:hypothetical protein